MTTVTTAEAVAATAPSTVAEVVVGYDGSPASRQALAWALEEATRRGATCRVVEVLPPLATVFANSSIEAGWLAAQLAAAADEMRTATRQVGEDVRGRMATVAVDPRIGPPSTTLVDAAKTAGLLVVGSRGHGRIGQLFVGSVARFAINHAHCPVVVIGPHAVTDD